MTWQITILRGLPFAAGLACAALAASAGQEMKVTIKAIPHEQQRYETVGDWHFNQWGNLEIKVSRMSDWRYGILIGVHELIEAVLCRQAGVPEEAVDAFDIAYEENRTVGNTSEPGDDPNAPYHAQHVAATKAERVLAKQLGVNWAAYSKEVESK